jgi:hypothetical protein
MSSCGSGLRLLARWISSTLMPMPMVARFWGVAPRRFSSRPMTMIL